MVRSFTRDQIASSTSGENNNRTTNNGDVQEEGKEGDSVQPMSSSGENQTDDQRSNDLDSLTSGQISEVSHRLRLWFPFVLIVLLHFLIAESAKINFILILIVVIRKLDGTLQEALSGKSSVNSISILTLLSVFTSSVPIIVVSIYFVNQIMGNSGSIYEKKTAFSIANHYMFRTQTEILDKSKPLSIYDAMWYSIAPDLIMQLFLIIVKTIFWILQYEYFLSLNRIGLLFSRTNRSSHEHADIEADVELGTSSNHTNSLEPLLGLNTSLTPSSPATSSSSSSYEANVNPSSRLSRRSNRLGTSSSTSSLPIQTQAQFMTSSSVSSLSSSVVKKKRVVNLIENFFYFYRSLLPSTVWTLYFSSGYGAEVFVTAYLFLKGSSLGVQFKSIYELVIALFQGKLEHGRYATPEETSASGNECYICFDSHRAPIMLTECEHVFCQHCIEEWLDRESTCPVCRQSVTSSLKSYNLMKGELNSSFPVCI